MTQPERFADPHGVEQQGKQQSIPQMTARIQNCLTCCAVDMSAYFVPS
jgi:hypothetical protein